MTGRSGIARVVGKQESDNRLYFRLARDVSAVGNGKQRKARSADRGPHDYCGRPVLYLSYAQVLRQGGACEKKNHLETLKMLL